jgi:hypothetical protein
MRQSQKRQRRRRRAESAPHRPRRGRSPPLLWQLAAAAEPPQPRRTLISLFLKTTRQHRRPPLPFLPLSSQMSTVEGEGRGQPWIQLRKQELRKLRGANDKQRKILAELFGPCPTIIGPAVVWHAIELQYRLPVDAGVELDPCAAGCRGGGGEGGLRAARGGAFVPWLWKGEAAR